MDNFVGMNVKIFMIFFLIAVSNISFYHFSPYSNVLTLSQNNCRNLKTFQAASQYNGDWHNPREPTALPGSYLNNSREIVKALWKPEYVPNHTCLSTN